MSTEGRDQREILESIDRNMGEFLERTKAAKTGAIEDDSPDRPAVPAPAAPAAPAPRENEGDPADHAPDPVSGGRSEPNRQTARKPNFFKSFLGLE